jgi:putative transposase
MGGRKLYRVLSPRLRLAGIQIGRDRFFGVLAKHDLLVESKSRSRRTTWAGAWRCENLLEKAELTGPNQAWVADITYLETDEGFCYLSLLTDAYSRYVVGFDVSVSLAVEGAEAALQRAVKAQATLPKGLIHHSDRGVQYTCRSYRRKQTKRHIRSSMGQTGNCYDNAIAERVNGIFKGEYGLGCRFATIQQARLAVIQAIWLYNHERPHLSLDYRTPYDLHQSFLRRRPAAKSTVFRAQGV